MMKEVQSVFSRSGGAMSREQERSLFWSMMALAALAFFAHQSHFRLMFDGLTYSAISKNILKTGDWRVLHYDLENYPDFYQHPPLAMWMQAIVYRFLGTAEPVSRILSSCFALGTLWALYSFAKRQFGAFSAFLSGLILISSTRFIKWGTNFYLDGILSFFLFFGFGMVLRGVSASDQSRATQWCLFLGAGAALACGFMVKGVASAPIVVSAALVPVFYALDSSRPLVARLNVWVWAWAGLSIGAAVPLGVWWFLGGGADFIRHYFAISVSGRLAPGSFSLAPWTNLYNVWWPWLPVFLLSCLRIVSGLRISSESIRQRVCWALAALSVPIVYSMTGQYLEHYLTPFYPFAAIVAGEEMSRWFSEPGVAFNVRFRGFVLILAILLATVVPDVNQQKPQPADLWLKELHTLSAEPLSRVKRLAFSKESADLWLNLAIVLGRSDWQAIGSASLQRPVSSGTVFITKEGEEIGSGWTPLPCLHTPGFRYYGHREDRICD